MGIRKILYDLFSNKEEELVRLNPYQVRSENREDLLEPLRDALGSNIFRVSKISVNCWGVLGFGERLNQGYTLEEAYDGFDRTLWELNAPFNYLVLSRKEEKYILRAFRVSEEVGRLDLEPI